MLFNYNVIELNGIRVKEDYRNYGVPAPKVQVIQRICLEKRHP